jgi:isochorismate synthase
MNGQEIIASKSSFAIFRLPRTEEIYILSGRTSSLTKELPKNSFVWADFEGNKYFLDEISTNKKLPINDFETSVDLSFIKDLLTDNQTIKHTLEEEFLQNVSLGIEKIKAEKINKVVFSKIKIQANLISDLKKSFLNLCHTNPETFVCLFHSPDFGVFLGASPELLLESKNDILRTVALAGTQQSMGKQTKDAVWTQKEIEEQALVCRFIVNCFKKIRLREFEERGPKTIQTGKLFHLKTDYIIHKKDTEVEHLEESLLSLLHPTSAVCGMPKEEAKSLIINNETHKRGLYTGFWGLTFDTDFHLYVNIRLVQLFKNNLVFYAGAGITEDSDPQTEWLETEAKCDNLLLKLYN